MITGVLIVAGVLLVLLLMIAARGRSPRVYQPEELQILMQSVDVEAFRNLIDPREEEYLRAKLPADEFRRTQLLRASAALAYVKVLARNSSALLRFAEEAKLSKNAQIARSAEDLAHNALQMRLYSLAAMARLYVGMVWPGAPIGMGTAEAYQKLTRDVVHLVSLSRPNLTSTISDSL